MVNPVPGYGISSAYGKRGPYWKSCGWHTGCDIGAPKGTPIVAPISGTIRHRNYGSAFGPYQFVISPSQGQPFAAGEVFFAHVLSRLKDGTEVKAGQVISKVGSLGNATGPHLHLEYHAVKQQWNCQVMRNPQPVIDWQPTGTKPPPTGGGGSAYPTPTSKKVYLSKLKYGQKDSDSVWYLQDALNKHSLPAPGNFTIDPKTGGYFTQTDTQVRTCQEAHGFTIGGKSDDSVGPSQAAHLFSGMGLEVIDDTGTTSPPPVQPPTTGDKPAAPSLLYPTAVWDPIAKSGGGYFTGLRAFKGTAKKITLHSTETAVKPNWVQQQSGIPHFTINLKMGNCWQHLPLDMAAYTLKGGTHSPNSDSGVNIQIEVIGYTRDAPNWSDEEYARLRLLCEWIAVNTGVPVDVPFPFVNPKRQGWSQWEQASGIVGHVHAPYNTHTDITGLDVDRLLWTPDKPVEPPVEPPATGGYATVEQLDAAISGLRADVAGALRGAADSL
jgi:hypothetical protein